MRPGHHFRTEFRLPEDVWRHVLARALSALTVWLAYGIGSAILQQAVFELFPDQDDNVWIIGIAVVVGIFGGTAIVVHAHTPVNRWWRRRLRLEPSRESQS